MSLIARRAPARALTVTGGTGQLLILPQGIAGKISRDARRSRSRTRLDLAPTSTIEVNRLPIAVDEMVGTTPLVLPAGPFLRVARLQHRRSTIGGQVDQRRLLLRAGRPQGRRSQKITKIAVANLQLHRRRQVIESATGALVMLPNGVAGVVLGKVGGASRRRPASA